MRSVAAFIQAADQQWATRCVGGHEKLLVVLKQKIR